MARIVELVLILNGLGGIATYLGIKAHRLKRGARRLVGVNDDEGIEPPAPDPRLVKELTADGSIQQPKKRSRLARFGDTIR